MRYALLHIAMIMVIACQQSGNKAEQAFVLDVDTALISSAAFPAFADSSSVDSMITQNTHNNINTRNIRPEAVVSFAQTLQGVPYKYASTDPNVGFDCSGFITYVFNHFDIQVPRSSVDFTHVGKEIKPAEAKPGDLILFTGTDSTIPVVGHMGIVVKNNPDSNLSFIHSTSGKAYGVTITPLSQYYQTRFVKVIRVFPEHLMFP